MSFPDSVPGPVTGNESIHLNLILKAKVKATIAYARGSAIAEAITDNGEDMRLTPILDRFAQELVRRDELDYDEIVSIFMEYGKPPRPLPFAADAPPAVAPVAAPVPAAPGPSAV